MTRLAADAYTAAPTAAANATAVATAILASPANKLATDASGHVTAANANVSIQITTEGSNISTG